MVKKMIVSYAHDGVDKDEFDSQSSSQSQGGENSAEKLIGLHSAAQNKFSRIRKHLCLSSIVVATTLGSLMWGFHFSVIAGAMLFVDDYFQLSALWHEIIVSVTIAGATIGAVIAGELSDKLGRRRALMISAVLYGIGSVVMGSAFSQLFLVIGRTVVGMAIGMHERI